MHKKFLVHFYYAYFLRCRKRVQNSSIEPAGVTRRRTWVRREARLLDSKRHLSSKFVTTNFHLVKINGINSYAFCGLCSFPSRRELLTTETDDKLIANAPIMGFIKIPKGAKRPAARGIPKVL